MADGCVLPNCHCSDVVVGLQKALAALQRRVADLEEKQGTAILVLRSFHHVY